MKNIAVLVSGGGTNLGALIDAANEGKIQSGTLALVVSSNPEAYALQRAKDAGIKSIIIEKKNNPHFEEDLIRSLIAHQIDLVVLAGFMLILSEKFIRHFENRIINVHPSLIPAFCGKGYYGLAVHRAALEYGVKLTGATVHFVNEVPDGGAIILQKSVEILESDTPESLQKRVMEEAEWELLPRAVSLFCEEKLTISGRRVIIE